MSLRNILPTAVLSSIAFAAPAGAQQPEAWARDILNSYTESNRERYFDNRMRAQIVSGEYQSALITADSLKAARSQAGRALPPIASFAYEVFATAKLNGSLDSAFEQRAAMVDDHTSAVAMNYVLTPFLPRLKMDYETALARVKAKDSVTMTDKIDVVRRAAGVMAFELIAPNARRLIAADDARRYIITRDILVRTPKGGSVCALVYRPRNAKAKITALLNFTIYESDQNTFEARRTASNGYAGVEGLTRGKGCSPNKPVSHEYDGIDAAALIDWIARQAWSDGRVGMYGGSYEGMTQWAAAKHMPRALKAMMPSVTHAPGIDFPIDGNIFMTYAYPWPFYTTNMKGLDSTTYNDSSRWTAMMRKWYTSGRPYRGLPKIDGTPNPIFERWLAHPSYDAYWQNMVAAGNDFARINIPVLTTTGYFDSGQIGALWFFREHTKHLPSVEHYLLIGPYDHIGGQRGNIDPMGRRSWSNIQGYELDSIADLDIGELRYEWFNYVFKGARKPALLKDKINFEVMNGNVWKHAPTLAAMADSAITIRLGKTIEQVVDLKDRSDVDKWGSTGDVLDPSSSVRSVIDTTTNIANAITFTSAPFDAPAEVSGLFSGEIEFFTNKKDFDFSVTLFELTPEEKYVQLNYHWQRASYASDRTRRVLLIPGRRTTLSFENNRLTSRRMQKGSRLVVVLAIEKNPSQQINYGSGKTVADESIADAAEPLRIQWLGGTRLHVPISRSATSRRAEGAAKQ
jgi:putative CocE/NonD family hydrolase